MNRKKKKLLFIRSKNKMRKLGYKEPKWKLVSKKFPTKWMNTNLSFLEESWIVDMRG